jgi:hypothetical protein
MCFAIFGVKGEGGVDCLFCVTNKISKHMLWQVSVLHLIEFIMIPNIRGKPNQQG